MPRYRSTGLARRRFVERVVSPALRGLHGSEATRHIEELPSGSFRVTVYPGSHPLTGRLLRRRETAKTLLPARWCLAGLEQAPEPEGGRIPAL